MMKDYFSVTRDRACQSLFQVVDASTTVNNDISLLVLTQRTSTASLVASVLSNVMLTVKGDISAGRQIIQKLSSAYTQQVDYLVQGLSEPISASASLLSVIQIIIVDSVTNSIPMMSQQLNQLSALKVT